MKNKDVYYDFVNFESVLGLFVGLIFIAVVFFAATNQDAIGMPKFANQKMTFSEIFSDSNVQATHLLASPIAVETYTIGVDSFSVDMNFLVYNIPEAYYDSVTKTFYHEYNGNRF